jgi:hypothetical protein
LIGRPQIVHHGRMDDRVRDEPDVLVQELVRAGDRRMIVAVCGAIVVVCGALVVLAGAWLSVR